MPPALCLARSVMPPPRSAGHHYSLLRRAQVYLSIALKKHDGLRHDESPAMPARRDRVGQLSTRAKISSAAASDVGVRRAQWPAARRHIVGASAMTMMAGRATTISSPAVTLYGLFASRAQDDIIPTATHFFFEMKWLTMKTPTRAGHSRCQCAGAGVALAPWRGDRHAGKR